MPLNIRGLLNNTLVLVEVPVYACLPVLNGAYLLEWAANNLDYYINDPTYLHTTVCYSTEPITVSRTNIKTQTPFTLPKNPGRHLARFGDSVVLILADDEKAQLVSIWKEFIELGASYDHPEYVPHITLSKVSSLSDEELASIQAYSGKLEFGDILLDEIRDDASNGLSHNRGLLANIINTPDTETAFLEEALHMPTLPVSGAWRKVVTAWAKTAGFKAIGKGAFGSVFYSEKKPDVVIKVFSDMSYYRWVQICKQHKNNPYAPKFRGSPVKLYKNINLWAIRVEKLKPFDTSIPLFDGIKSGIWAMHLQDWIAYLLDQEYGLSYYRRYWPKEPGSSGSPKKKLEQWAEDYYYSDEDLMELVSALGMYLTHMENGLHFKLDLHADNIMLRGSQPVLIDPIMETHYMPKLLRERIGISEPSIPSTNV